MQTDPHRTRGRIVGRTERRADAVSNSHGQPQDYYIRLVGLTRRPGANEAPYNVCVHPGARR